MQTGHVWGSSAYFLFFLGFLGIYFNYYKPFQAAFYQERNPTSLHSSSLFKYLLAPSDEAPIENIKLYHSPFPGSIKPFLVRVEVLGLKVDVGNKKRRK